MRWTYPGLYGALRHDRPDLVHVIAEPWGLLAAQAAVWSRAHPRTALVIHGADRSPMHGFGSERVAKRLLARFTLGRADAYAAESEMSVTRARSLGLPADSLGSVIHANPRNHGVFSPPADESERRRCRARLGLPEEGVGIGFLGRLSHNKGPALFWTPSPSYQRETGLRWQGLGHWRIR